MTTFEAEAAAILLPFRAHVQRISGMLAPLRLRDNANNISDYEAFWKEWDSIESTPFDMPEGWSSVGMGAYRKVFRAPSGFLYKINRYPENDYMGNDDEWRNFLRLRGIDFGDGWAIVDMVTVVVGEGDTAETVIVCDEVIGHDEDHISWNCARDDCKTCTNYRRAESVSGLRDIHPGNYRVRRSDGKRILIDLGG